MDGASQGRKRQKERETEEKKKKSGREILYQEACERIISFWEYTQRNTPQAYVKDQACGFQ